MTGLTLYDYILFPVYFYVIWLIFKKIRSRYVNDTKKFRYFTWGFRIKIVIIIAYTLLSHYVIRGDAVDLYFGEGKHFAEIIKSDISRIDLLFTQGGKEIDDLASPEEKGYLAMENNYMVVKVCTLLCFITFSCFSLINLIVGFIAFLGSWQLYLFFLRQYPQMHKEFAFACLGIPTVLFWSAGISKDTTFLNGFEAVALSRKQVRDGLMGVIEFKPNKDVHSTVDLYYSKFSKKYVGRELQQDGFNTWSGTTITNAVYENWDGEKVLVGGTATGLSAKMLTRANHRDDSSKHSAGPPAPDRPTQPVRTGRS